MGLIQSFTRPALARPNIYETVPGVIGTTSFTMTANQALAARVYLPYGPMPVTTLGYLCVAAVGNVELLIARPTAKDGLVVDLVATTGMVAASGTNAIQSIALTSAAVLQDNDFLIINPSGALQIRYATSYPTAGALKNRFALKGSAPNPWSGQVTLSTAANAPYIVAYG